MVISFGFSYLVGKIGQLCQPRKTPPLSYKRLGGANGGNGLRGGLRFQLAFEDNRLHAVQAYSLVSF